MREPPFSSSPILREPPQFVARSELLARAYELAHSAHHGPARVGDTDIEHPLAVAEVLHAHGFDDQVVAAAILHDVVEDSEFDLSTIAARFGPEVERLVAEMTEDSGIASYEERKAEHRSRVSRDRQAAAIYGADKLAKARALSGAEDIPRQQLDHYLQTLHMLCEQHPDLPYLAELREELMAVAARQRSV
jgi:GTP diphosphokinase / guanosine-3',5'-bis(diphosphate) 3'-diphosphatase